MSSSVCVYTWFIITRNVHKSICVWVWGVGGWVKHYQKNDNIKINNGSLRFFFGEYQNGGYDDKSLKIYGPN